MELRHLRYYSALAEELHFGRAAKRLGIAQPALSQQIRQLEQELGVELVLRGNRRVRLTSAGTVFLDRARTTLEQASEAVRLAQQAGRGEIGHIAVGVVTSALYGIFPDVVRVFRQRYKDVHLTLHELTLVDQTQALRAGRIQVSFLRPPLEDPELSMRTIHEEPWLVALPSTHRLTKSARVPLRSLAGHPFILFPRELASGLYDQIIAMCQHAGFSPKVVQEAQMQTIVSLVAAGIGIALVPASLENLRRRGVSYRPLKGATPKVQLAVVWRKDDTSPLLRSFLAVVKEVAG